MQRKCLFRLKLENAWILTTPRPKQYEYQLKKWKVAKNKPRKDESDTSVKDSKQKATAHESQDATPQISTSSKPRGAGGLLLGHNDGNSVLLDTKEHYATKDVDTSSSDISPPPKEPERAHVLTGSQQLSKSAIGESDFINVATGQSGTSKEQCTPELPEAMKDPALPQASWSPGTEHFLRFAKRLRGKRPLSSKGSLARKRKQARTGSTTSAPQGPATNPGSVTSLVSVISSLSLGVDSASVTQSLSSQEHFPDYLGIRMDTIWEGTDTMW
jgi:hypothetical protein